MFEVVFKHSALGYLRLNNFQTKNITAEMRNAESRCLGMMGNKLID
jgi:hypothetical protein